MGALYKKNSGIYLFFTATYFAQGLVGIAYTPIYYLQRDVLRLSPSESGAFVMWMTLPFLFKPVLGLVTDAFPLGGRRRFPYLVLSALATSATWLTLASIGSYSYRPALALLTAVNVGIIFADVLCDGVMVEQGKRLNKTGAFQAAQIGALYLSLLIAGSGGGWLAEHASYRTVFGLTAAFPLLIFATSFFIREVPEPDPSKSPRLALAGLWSLARRKNFWASCLLILLFSFHPFQGTSMFYYQADTLGFSKFLIGSLTSVDGVAGVVGAGLFWKLYNKDMVWRGRAVRLDTSLLVRLSILAGVPLTLLFWAYRTPAAAVLITAVYGLAGVAMRLSIMDLVARICPEHAEATAFAVFMSVFNLAAWTSNASGAWILDNLKGPLGGEHGAMAAGVAIGALCTAACWPVARAIEKEGGAPA